MRSPVAAGARFVLLNTAVARVDLARARSGLPYHWRYGPATRDIGEPPTRRRAHLPGPRPEAAVTGARAGVRAGGD